MKTLHPLILTARIAKMDLQPFELLRRQHFPPDRNFLQAHLTMFYRLPGERTNQIVDALSMTSGNAEPFQAAVAGVRHLGAGVAVNIAGPELMRIHAGLRSLFLLWLGGQDMQKWNPHITVQNKVSRPNADALHRHLSSEFEPRSILVEGLELWRYLGGPWQLEHRAMFGTTERPKSREMRRKAKLNILSFNPIWLPCLRIRRPPPPDLIRSWTLSSAVTLGSAVRTKGIVLELRARLPVAWRKSLDVYGATLVLSMAREADADFRSTVDNITTWLVEIDKLYVIPREIEDILAISTGERRRWLEDGRLPSAGTRTVRLRGRARQITFHIYDPKVVEHLLDSGVVDEWREEDAVAKAENRRRSAFQAILTRSLKKQHNGKPQSESVNANGSVLLAGWEEFDREGILRYRLGWK